MRAPIHMMRILHQARVGNIQTMYFWLNGSGHKINPEMVCSICNKYEKENVKLKRKFKSLRNYIYFFCSLYCRGVAFQVVIFFSSLYYVHRY